MAENEITLEDIHHQLMVMNEALADLVEMTRKASAVLNSPLGRLATKTRTIKR